MAFFGGDIEISPPKKRQNNNTTWFVIGFSSRLVVFVCFGIKLSCKKRGRSVSLVSGWQTSRVMYLISRSRMNVVVPPQLGPLNYFNLGFEAIKPDHFRTRAVGRIKREAEEKFQCHNGAQGTGRKFLMHTM